MLIHGKERKFSLTVGAAMEIAALCPGGDLRNMGEALKESYNGKFDLVVAIIVAMNKGYEQARAYEEPGYAPDPIEAAEVLTISVPELVQLRQEAFEAFAGDAKTTVETEPAKKKEKKSA